MVKYSMTKVRSGRMRKKIWLSVMAHGPSVAISVRNNLDRAKYFPIQFSHYTTTLTKFTYYYYNKGRD